MSTYKLTKKDYSDVFDQNVKRISRVDKEGNCIPDPKERVNWKYNNAYQNLRHDFINSLPVFGTLEYLFESLAVLFVVLEIKISRIFAIKKYAENGLKSVAAIGSDGLLV